MDDQAYTNELLRRDIGDLSVKYKELEYRMNTHVHARYDLTTPLPPISTQTVYASGTAYALTDTAAALDFGTTDPSLTISALGTYLIFARVKLDYNAATFAAVRTATLKLRRTNNTAADLTSGSTTFKTDIITTKTYTAGNLRLPTVVYTSTTAGDIIKIFGSIDVVPSAGSIDASEAEIVAVRIS